MTDYLTPIVTVDTTLFTLVDGRLCILLLRREKDPFAGALALPGGYVHVDKDATSADTAERVIREKVGIAPPFLEQLFTFSGGFRDPRGWSVSIAYVALVPGTQLDGALHDAVEVVPVDHLPDMPFDHRRIIDKALERIRGKSTYSSLPAFLLPELFTLPELQRVYEQVIGASIDKVTFRRRILEQGLVEEAAGKTEKRRGRPAQLYRLSSPDLRQFQKTL